MAEFWASIFRSVSLLQKDRKAALRSRRRERLNRVEVLEERRMLNVDFKFIYLDDFFQDHPERRQMMEIAGEYVAGRLQDDLSAIRPTGNNTWTAKFSDPTTGKNRALRNLEVPADTMIVFVGARDLPGDTRGYANRGFSWSGSSSWGQTVRTRGESTSIGPWGGSISFDDETNWHWGLTTSGLTGSKTDFLSVAIHELGHILGLDHFPAGRTSEGAETAMDPDITGGTRKMFTEADWDALSAKGWEVGPHDRLVIARVMQNGRPADGIFNLTVSNERSSGGFTIETSSIGYTTRSYFVDRIYQSGYDDTWDTDLAFYEYEDGDSNYIDGESRGVRRYSSLAHEVTFLELIVNTGYSLTGGARSAVDEAGSLVVSGAPGSVNDVIYVHGSLDIEVNGNEETVSKSGLKEIDFNSGAGADVLRLSANHVLSGIPDVHYSAGAGNDRLEINNGTWSNVHVALSGAGRGRLEIDGVGYDFDNLETLDLLNRNYVYGSIGSLTLDLIDDEGHTVILEDFGTASDGVMRLRTDDGFTEVIFRRPTQQLRILTGGGYDVVQQPSRDSTFNASLTVDLGNGQDAIVATAADAGGGPHVRVFDARTGVERFGLFAYDPRFTGGVRIATGDVNGDGVMDVITSPGAGGGPHVRVFSGANGALLREFFAYAPGFTGGVYVAAGDVNGDGKADIITSAGAGGGPHVRVFSGASGELLREFFAYAPGFTGGVRVAAGDVNGDGLADIITSPGAGGGPHVRVFSGSNGALLREFFAYDIGFTGGIFVASADFNSDGKTDIVTSPDVGGGPHIRVFSGASGTLLRDFFAYNPAFLGGVRVAVGDDNGDRTPEIITSPGPTGGPHVRMFNGDNSVFSSIDLFAFHPGFRGGVFVAGNTSNFDQFLGLVGDGQHAEEDHAVLPGSFVSSLAAFPVPSQPQADSQPARLEEISEVSIRLQDADYTAKTTVPAAVQPKRRAWSAILPVDGQDIDREGWLELPVSMDQDEQEDPEQPLDALKPSPLG